MALATDRWPLTTGTKNSGGSGDFFSQSSVFSRQGADVVPQWQTWAFARGKFMTDPIVFAAQASSLGGAVLLIGLAVATH